MRAFTKTALAKELDRARGAGWDKACADAEKATRLPAALLLAVASQETDMNDVVGDGGHGRGLFQIDDRSHRDFLARSGAAGAGGKPPVPVAARYAADLLRWNWDFGERSGVPERDRLLFALSAYTRAREERSPGIARATPTSGRRAATTAARCSPAGPCTRSCWASSRRRRSCAAARAGSASRS